MGKYCVVCRVPFKSGDNRSFHRIPSNIERRNIWLSLILSYLGKKSIPKDSVVCSDHFPSFDFSTRPSGRVYLKQLAVPEFPSLSKQNTVCTETALLTYSQEPGSAGEDHEKFLKSPRKKTRYPSPTDTLSAVSDGQMTISAKSSTSRTTTANSPENVSQISSSHRQKRRMSRCLLWRANVKNPNIDNYDSEYCYQHFTICSVHFKSNMFSSMQGNHLKRDVVPTIFGEEQRESADENIASPTASKNVEDAKLFSQAALFDATSSTSKGSNVLDIPGASTFLPKRLSLDEDQEYFDNRTFEERDNYETTTNPTDPEELQPEVADSATQTSSPTYPEKLQPEVADSATQT